MAASAYMAITQIYALVPAECFYFTSELGVQCFAQVTLEPLL